MNKTKLASTHHKTKMSNENNSYGYFNVPRSDSTHWSFLELTQNGYPDYLAMLDLRSIASYSTNTKKIYSHHLKRKIEFTEQRGQHITTLRELGDKWGWHRHKVLRFLNRLVEDKIITKKGEGRVAIRVTICNYDLYQNAISNTSHATSSATSSATSKPELNNCISDTYKNKNEHIITDNATSKHDSATSPATSPATSKVGITNSKSSNYGFFENKNATSPATSSATVLKEEKKENKENYYSFNNSSSEFFLENFQGKKIVEIFQNSFNRLHFEKFKSPYQLKMCRDKFEKALLGIGNNFIKKEKEKNSAQKEKEKEYTEEQLSNLSYRFFKTAYEQEDNFMRDHFDPSLINYRFDQIYLNYKGFTKPKEVYVAPKYNLPTQLPTQPTQLPMKEYTIEELFENSKECAIEEYRSLQQKKKLSMLGHLSSEFLNYIDLIQVDSNQWKDYLEDAHTELINSLAIKRKHAISLNEARSLDVAIESMQDGCEPEKVTTEAKKMVLVDYFLSIPDTKTLELEIDSKLKLYLDKKANVISINPYKRNEGDFKPLEATKIQSDKTIGNSINSVLNQFKKPNTDF